MTSSTRSYGHHVRARSFLRKDTNKHSCCVSFAARQLNSQWSSCIRNFTFLIPVCAQHFSNNSCRGICSDATVILCHHNILTHKIIKINVAYTQINSRRRCNTAAVWPSLTWCRFPPSADTLFTIKFAAIRCVMENDRFYAQRVCVLQAETSWKCARINIACV